MSTYRGDRRDPPYSTPPLALPPGYLAKGYFEKDACPYREVILDWPKALADALSSGRPRLETTQLRRFYNAARQVERKLDATRDFDCAKADLFRLTAFAHQSVKKEKAPLLFERFMELNVSEAVKSVDHFRRGFLTHFECIVAFYPESRRR